MVQVASIGSVPEGVVRRKERTTILDEFSEHCPELRALKHAPSNRLDSKLKQRDRLFSIFADSSALFLSKVLSCLCCAVHSSLHAHLHTHEHAYIHLYVLPCLHKIKHTCMHLCIDMYVKNVHIDPFPPSGDRAFSF